MKVLLDPQHAAPVLRSLAPETKRSVRKAPRLLGEDPSGAGNGLDVRRLDTKPGQAMYRLRIGVSRAVFTVDRAVVVLRVFHRRDGYGWLARGD